MRTPAEQTGSLARDGPSHERDGRVFVIQNPAAGGRHPERLRRRIENVLESRRVAYGFAFTEAPGHARELAEAAVQDGYARVLVVGGDGTVMDAVAAMADSDTVLGLVPAGTGNQLAANLGVPTRIAPAIDIAVGGDERRIDVGMINRRPFTVMAGAGFDAAVINPDPRLKRILGYLAYVTAAAAELFKPQVSDLTVTVDGETINLRGVGIEVANQPGIRPPGLPWPVHIIRSGRIDDGFLDVCVLGARTSLGLVSVLTSFMTMRPERNRRIHYYRGREITVDADPPLPVQADGELFGSTPFTATVRPKALSVAVPARQPTA